MRRNSIIFVILCLFIFLLAGSGWLWRLFSPVIHKDIINRYAGEYKFDPLLIMALVKVESNFSHQAVSSRGAVGLMQLLPATAQEMADDLDMKNYSPETLAQPEINIQLGFHYLAKLRSQTNGDLVQMLAAYNAGFNNMMLWKKDRERLYPEDIAFKETRNFVKRVITTYEWLRRFQKLKKTIEFV